MTSLARAPLSIRPLILPSATCLVAFALLLGLGSWQVQRLAWKNAWTAQLKEGEARPPEPLPSSVQDPAALSFRRFAVTGTYRHDLSIVLGVAEHDRRIGAFLVTPLIRPDNPAPLWIVRGWVPLETPRAVANPEGEVTVSGYLMLPERRGTFTPDDKPLERRFWAMQPRLMADTVRLPAPEEFAIVLTGRADAAPFPAWRPPNPRNDHLGYAITWFGLAGALVACWIAWVRRQLRDQQGLT